MGYGFGKAFGILYISVFGGNPISMKILFRKEEGYYVFFKSGMDLTPRSI